MLSALVTSPPTVWSPTTGRVLATIGADVILLPLAVAAALGVAWLVERALVARGRRHALHIVGGSATAILRRAA